MGKIDPRKTKLSRSIQAIPVEIMAVLKQEGLLDDYYARPDYQQNDYIAWITRAKQTETREKRIHQMLDELQKGGVYMGMDHPASRK